MSSLVAASTSIEPPVDPNQPQGETFNQQPTVIVQMEGSQKPPAGKQAPRGRSGGAVGEQPAPLGAYSRRPVSSWSDRFDREKLLLAGAIVLAVVLAATVTAWLVGDDEGRSGKDPVMVEIDERSGKATLEITSEPSGAQVKVNGEWLFERTPTRQSVPAGATVQIRVAMGEDYEPFDLKVSPNAGQVIPVDAKLKRISGAVTVESRPSDAMVYLNGENVGRTPVTWSGLPINQPVKIRVSRARIRTSWIESLILPFSVLSWGTSPKWPLFALK